MTHGCLASFGSASLAAVVNSIAAGAATAVHRRRQEGRPSGLLRFHGSAIGAAAYRRLSKRNIRSSKSTPRASARREWPPGWSPKPKRARCAPMSCINRRSISTASSRKGCSTAILLAGARRISGRVPDDKGLWMMPLRDAQRDRLQQRQMSPPPMCRKASGI